VRLAFGRHPMHPPTPDDASRIQNIHKTPTQLPTYNNASRTRRRRTPPTPDDASRMQYSHKTRATSPGPGPIVYIINIYSVYGIRGIIPESSYSYSRESRCAAARRKHANSSGTWRRGPVCACTRAVCVLVPPNLYIHTYDDPSSHTHTAAHRVHAFLFCD